MQDQNRVQLREKATDQGHAATMDVQHQAEALDLEFVHEIQEGVPETRTLEYVREEGIDMVVMGTRGRTGPEKHHFGSTRSRYWRKRMYRC